MTPNPKKPPTKMDAKTIAAETTQLRSDRFNHDDTIKRLTRERVESEAWAAGDKSNDEIRADVEKAFAFLLPPGQTEVSK